MRLWIFKCYLKENGLDAMKEWYEELPVKARSRFKMITDHLREIPRSEWNRPYFAKLTEGEGIYEVIVNVAGINYRPLGFFGPAVDAGNGESRIGQFIFVLGAKEKGNRFVPKDAIDIAIKRKDIIINDWRRAHECFKED